MNSETATPCLRFGLIADLHYSDRSRWLDRFYAESRSKLVECVTHMNRQGAEFLCQLGDLKDVSDPPDFAATCRLLEDIDAEFRKFKGPRHHVVGNHDLDELTKSDFFGITDGTPAPYSFRAGPIRFVVLDSCFRPDGVEYARDDFDWTQSFLPSYQLQWLKKVLDQATEPVIVFSHQRLDDEPPYSIRNARDVRSVMESRGQVLAVFQGHDHRGDLRLIRGIHYYTLSGAVESISNSFVLVEVLADLTINVTGHGRAQSALLVPNAV